MVIPAVPPPTPGHQDWGAAVSLPLLGLGGREIQNSGRRYIVLHEVIIHIKLLTLKMGKPAQVG
jgi:hypothetical protein